MSTNCSRPGIFIYSSGVALRNELGATKCTKCQLQLHYIVEHCVKALCRALCQTLSNSKISTKNKDKHDAKETRKLNENAQKWNSNLSIKTINSNGLKWLCATVELEVTMKRQLSRPILFLTLVFGGQTACNSSTARNKEEKTQQLHMQWM